MLLLGTPVGEILFTGKRSKTPCLPKFGLRLDISNQNLPHAEGPRETSATSHRPAELLRPKSQKNGDRHLGGGQPGDHILAAANGQVRVM